MDNKLARSSEYKRGIIASIACPTLWGFLPLYWQLLDSIDSWVIIIYRIFLVCVTALIIARFRFSWAEITAPLRKSWKHARIFLASGIFVTMNWSLYIWGVNSGQVIQTSIGYYIEPLMVCLFGIIFFHEPLSKNKIASLLFALAGVVILLIHFHQLPGLALGLAVTFAIYSAIKKTVKEPAVLSLLYETMYFAPFALVVCIWLETHGIGALRDSQPWQYALLMTIGAATLIPLGIFSYAAQRVPMFILGLAEYISPTISLLLGIFLLKEDFDRVQLAAFCMIWIGLIIFTIGELRGFRNTSARDY